MRITPSRPVAPRWVPFVFAVIYVVIAVLTVVALATNECLVLSLAFALVALSFFVDRHFSWYSFAEVLDKGDMVLYRRTELVSVFGRDVTSFEIRRVDDVMVKGSDLRVFGSIRKHEPMSKAMDIKSVLVLDYTQEVLELFEKFCCKKY